MDGQSHLCSTSTARATAPVFILILLHTHSTFARTFHYLHLLPASANQTQIRIAWLIVYGNSGILLSVEEGPGPSMANIQSFQLVKKKFYYGTEFGTNQYLSGKRTIYECFLAWQPSWRAALRGFGTDAEVLAAEEKKC